MPFLSELTEKKQILIKELLSDQIFCDLVSGEVGHAIPAIDLRYKQVYPVSWVDSAISEAKTFVCFDMDVTGTSSIAVKNSEIYFWLFTHKNLMFTEKGILIDILASRIDELVNGSTELGFGKVKLESAGRWSPNAAYYGRVLTYSVKGWNRSGIKI